MHWDLIDSDQWYNNSLHVIAFQILINNKSLKVLLFFYKQIYFSANSIGLTCNLNESKCYQQRFSGLTVIDMVIWIFEIVYFSFFNKKYLLIFWKENLIIPN